MRARRTAIVPNMIWGTAVASIIPLQLTACGGSSSEPSSGGSGGQANHAGSTSQGGHAGAGAGGTDQGYAGYIVLAIAAFGNEGGSLPGSSGAGGSDVMMGGSGGDGSAGKAPNGSAGFIVLAAAAFGGAKQ